jgi:glycosyltransferase involved in cell wall biosynthesis/O-antigen/teichoic acid export membrane protein
MALRFGWGVADQAVSSLENFLLGVFVARTLGAASLGALGIALLIYAMVVNVSRGMSSDPLMVRFTGSPDERWRQAVGPAVGAAFCVGLAFAPACLLVGGALLASGGTELGQAFVVLGLVLPGLTVQDCWRYVFFSVGRGSQAFANDLVWTALLVIAFLVGEPLGLGGIEWAMACFGGTAYLAAGYGALQARVMPHPRHARRWVRSQRDLTTKFVYTNLTAGVGGQVRPFIVAVIAGLAAAGAIRGGQMLVGPALALLMGIAQVAVPEAVRALAVGRRAFWKLCVVISGSLGVLSATWGLAIMLILPLGLGTTLLGDVWGATQPLMLPIVIGATAGCLQIGPSAGLRALERADLTLRVQALATVLSIGSCTVGALAWGASGAVWGTAVASAVSASVWWACLRSATAEHGARTASASSSRPRIVIATLMREHGASGVQTHMTAVRNQLRAQRVDCVLITPFSHRSWSRTPVFAMRFAMRRFGRDTGMRWYLTWHAHYLTRALRRELLGSTGPVVLYAQCPVSARVALRVRTSQPVVLVTHFNISQANEWADQGEITREGALFRSVRREEDRVLAEVDALVHVSAYNQRLLEVRVPATRGIPHAVIPNFIEPRPLVPSAVQGDLVTVGGLEPRKNQRYLIEVVAAAAELGHRYSLAIIGAGPERRALEDLARRRGVDDLVRFLGYQDDPRRLMAGHRVYCHASRMESFGISLLEAMDAGLPIAAAPVGGVPEVMRDGVEGFFWPLDDPAAGAERLVSVLEDDRTRSAMAEAARERLLTTFATEQVSPRLVEFLCGRARVEMVGAG